MRCSTITKRMASACAACMSRRGAPATMRRRCNMRCAPTRARPPPGPVRRSSTTARDAEIGPARSRPSTSNAGARLIDKPTANRWRAVIKTAMAEEAMERDPKAALALAQEACKLAPTLVPAAAISGRLTAQAGDFRRASRMLEAAYAQTPHPDLAAAYLRVRHGDSSEDRLARARALARMAPLDPESSLTVGRAALDAHDVSAARAAIAPLIASDSSSGRPTRRVCLLMADIEETEGNHGAVREWLGRAARAPRDKAWVADGVISDRWAPVSPSGTLDGFVWRTPDERLAAQAESRRRPPPPPTEAIAAPIPAPAITPAPEAVGPEPAQAPDFVPAPRTGVIIDPASMSPDDPGPQEREAKRRGSALRQ